MADEEILCDVESLNEPFRTLIQAGIRAPSGDNTQGWDFGIDATNGVLEIFRNEQRDTSPMNAGQRMTSIACGACAENVRQTAAANGWDTVIEFTDSPSIRIHVDHRSAKSGVIPAIVVNRHTNRKVYGGRRIGVSERKTLEDRIEVPDGIELQLITESMKIEQYADVIGQADARMFGQQRFLRAFLDNVRFDQPPDISVDFGLSTGSLELSPVERLSLRYLRHLPEAVTNSLPMRRTFRRKATALVQSASGLCVINAPNSTAESEFKVGRAMQRTWLTLTELGFAVQPMMSLPVLLGHESFTPADEKVALGRDDLLTAAFETNLVQKTNRFCPLGILRFGDALAVTARTGRMKNVTIHLSAESQAKESVCGTY